MFCGYQRGLGQAEILPQAQPWGGTLGCPVVLSRPWGRKQWGTCQSAWSTTDIWPSCTPAGSAYPSAPPLPWVYTASGGIGACGSCVSLRALSGSLLLGRAPATGPQSSRAEPGSIGCVILTKVVIL